MDRKEDRVYRLQVERKRVGKCQANSHHIVEEQATNRYIVHVLKQKRSVQREIYMNKESLSEMTTISMSVNE